MEKVKTVRSVIWWSKQLGKAGAQENEENLIETRKFPEGSHPAQVTVSRGVTINMGNYQTARCDVGISLPCLPEEVEEVYNYASSMVESRIQQETEELRKTRGE